MKDIFSTVIPAAVLAFVFNAILSVIKSRFDEKNKLIEKCSYYNRQLFNLNDEYRRMIYGIIDVKDPKNEMTNIADTINFYSISSLTILKLDIEKDIYFFHLLNKYKVPIDSFNKWLKSSSNELTFQSNMESGKTLLAEMQRQVKKNKTIVLWHKFVTFFMNDSR